MSPMLLHFSVAIEPALPWHPLFPDFAPLYQSLLFSVCSYFGFFLLSDSWKVFISPPSPLPLVPLYIPLSLLLFSLSHWVSPMATGVNPLLHHGTNDRYCSHANTSYGTVHIFGLNVFFAHLVTCMDRWMRVVILEISFNFWKKVNNLSTSVLNLY